MDFRTLQASGAEGPVGYPDENLDVIQALEYHLRNISMATEILDWLRFTYGFENWYP